MKEPQTTAERAFCYRCFKALSVCVCNSIQRLANRTHITLIQHPRERNHPIGTARFLNLGLSHVRLVEDTDGRLRSGETLVSLPPDAGVLYPGPEAIDLEGLAPEKRPSHLVVIDGTWHQAKTLYRDVPWVRELTHYKLTPKTGSRYRIRREPQIDYVSTLEATLLALLELEPELAGVPELLLAFDGMIDAQIAHVGKSEAPRVRARKRELGRRRLPRALFELFEQLVVVYAESCSPAWADSSGRATFSDGTPFTYDRKSNQDEASELLYFAAYRVRSGEHFEALIQPQRGVLNERHLKHMALSATERDALGDPITHAAFAERFRVFAHASDAYTAWNHSALRWLPDVPALQGRSVFLKAAYGGLQRFGGALEEIVAQEGLSTLDVPFAGRARQRLGNALALVAFLRNREHSGSAHASDQRGADAIGETLPSSRPSSGVGSTSSAI